MEEFYKITNEKDQEELLKLEKAYFEMLSLQTLLTNIILDNPKTVQYYELYMEKYMEKYAILEKQKNIFHNKVLAPVFIDNFKWIADFQNTGVKIIKYDNE